PVRTDTSRVAGVDGPKRAIKRPRPWMAAPRAPPASREDRREDGGWKGARRPRERRPMDGPERAIRQTRRRAGGGDTGPSLDADGEEGDSVTHRCTEAYSTPARVICPTHFLDTGYHL